MNNQQAFNYADFWDIRVAKNAMCGLNSWEIDVSYGKAVLSGEHMVSIG